MRVEQARYLFWKVSRAAATRVLRRSDLKGLRTDQFIRFVAFFERSSNGFAHYHVIGRFEGSVGVRFAETFTSEWRRRFPRADGAHLQHLDNLKSRARAITYASKDAERRQENLDGLCSSWDVLPAYCRQGRTSDAEHIARTPAATQLDSTAYIEAQRALRERFRSVHATRRQLERRLRAQGIFDFELTDYLPEVDWSEFAGLSCGAKTRGGTPCKQTALYACGRCRFHGGKSTGPRTSDGKARSALNGNQHGRTP